MTEVTYPRIMVIPNALLLIKCIFLCLSRLYCTKYLLRIITNCKRQRTLFHYPFNPHKKNFTSDYGWGGTKHKDSI